MQYNLKYTDKWQRQTLEKEKDFDFFSKKRPSVRKEKRAVILPCKKVEQDGEVLVYGGGVLDEHLNFVKESEQLVAGAIYGQAYTFEMENMLKCSNTIIYMGPYFDQWGHFLLQVIPRIWYILEEKREALIGYIGTGRTRNIARVIEGPYLEFLELFGLKKEQFIPINQPMQFEEIIVPEPACCINAALINQRYYTNEFKDIFDRVRKRVKVYDEPKIYLTRTSLKKEYEIGEERIETFFRENGYKIISPEVLSVEEQIAYIKGASRIATTLGTLSHMVLFAEQGIELIIINRGQKTNLLQPVVNQMKDVSVTYIDASWLLLPELYSVAPFIYRINSNLRRYAADNGMRISEDSRQSGQGKFIELLWYLLSYVKCPYDMEVPPAMLERAGSREFLEMLCYYKAQLTSEEHKMIDEFVQTYRKQVDFNNDRINENNGNREAAIRDRS